MDGCLFCKIAAGEIPSRKVYEDEHLLAFEDIAPQAPTHVVVIPKRHLATLDDLGPSDADLAGRLLLACAAIARERSLDRAGYRLVSNCRESAGQSVFHLHVHLLGGRRFSWPPG